ncbi:MAG: SRPBCC family protein [Gemmatimonadaceae bacterium]
MTAHVEHSGDFVLNLPCSEAFSLFSPEGERQWVDGWAPEYLHPAGPSTAPGTVFHTRQGGEETLWLVLRYDVVESVAEYVRVTMGSRLATVRVHCRPASEGATRVTVAYAMTAIAPAGHAHLAALDAELFGGMLRKWREAIERAIPAAASSEGRSA